MDHDVSNSTAEGADADSSGNVVLGERRASVRAISITLIVWFVIIAVLAVITSVQINAPIALLLSLILSLFPLFSFINWIMFRMIIDPEKIQLVRTFIFRNKESLEFNKVEGVDITQGPFGRVFDYGRLTISGVGIKQLRTEPIDRPDHVAREIRALIARR